MTVEQQQHDAMLRERGRALHVCRVTTSTLANARRSAKEALRRGDTSARTVQLTYTPFRESVAPLESAVAALREYVKADPSDAEVATQLTLSARLLAEGQTLLPQINELLGDGEAES
jgi:hypothetical protein